MKKIILCAFLTLLSFNANARCFEGNIDEEYINCNIAEAVSAMNKTSPNFIVFSRGYLRGVSNTLTLLSIAQGKQTLNCDYNYSLRLIHDIVYDDVKNGEVSLDADYHLILGAAFAKRFYKCIADKEKQQQNSIDL